MVVVRLRSAVLIDRSLKRSVREETPGILMGVSLVASSGLDLVTSDVDP